MQALLLSFPLFAILCLNFAKAKSSGGPVTCGSVIKIIHKETVMFSIELEFVYTLALIIIIFLIYQITIITVSI